MVGCRGVFNVYIPAAHVTDFRLHRRTRHRAQYPETKDKTEKGIAEGRGERGGRIFARTPGHETATSGTGVPAS